MQKNGIDISYSQGAIDWNKVKAAGIDFAMLRLGRRSGSGSLGLDSYFEMNAKQAFAAGVDIGAYFYSNAKSIADAMEEADFTIKELNKFPETFTYPIAFDMEVDFTNFAKQSKSLNTEIAKAFLSKLQDAGYYAMLYTYKSFTNEHLNMSELSAYDFWLAHVGLNGAAKTSTDYSAAYGIWQYSWKGKVNGISTDVDLDYAYQDYPSIVKAIGLNGFDGENKKEIVDDLNNSASDCKECKYKTFYFETLATIERLAGEMNKKS